MSEPAGRVTGTTHHAHIHRVAAHHGRIKAHGAEQAAGHYERSSLPKATPDAAIPGPPPAVKG